MLLKKVKNPLKFMAACIFLLVFIPASFSIQGKAGESDDILSLFTYTNVPKLHVCVDDQAQEELKEKQLDRVTLLARCKEINEQNMFEYDIYASLCFQLDNCFDGYLVEENICATHTKIFLLVYDRTRGYFTQVIEVAYRYGYEGSGGDKESYFFDLNDDGSRDIVAMEFTESFIPKEENSELTCEYVPNHKNSVLLFRDGKYREYEGFITLNY